VQDLLLPELLPVNLIGLFAELVPLSEYCEFAAYTGLTHKRFFAAVDVELASDLYCFGLQSLHLSLEFCLLSLELFLTH
jgi:hypothetical protein